MLRADMRTLRSALLVAVVIAAGIGELAGQGVAATLTVSSTAFKNGEAIPADYTADGRNVSPALAWSGAPPGTREFALILDDPDARDISEITLAYTFYPVDQPPSGS